MSDISRAVELSLQLADVAITDAAGKVNVIGMFVDVIGYNREIGSTGRFTVIGEVLVPPELCPAEITTEIVLLHADGRVVQLPGLADQEQAVRIGMPQAVAKPSVVVDGHVIDGLWARCPIILDFNNGLPLTPGTTYIWRLRVDGDDENARNLTFAVPGLPATPVLG